MTRAAVPLMTAEGLARLRVHYYKRFVRAGAVRHGTPDCH